MPDAVPLFDPSDVTTGVTSAAVTGCRFLRISGTRIDGLVQVAHVNASGGRVYGLAVRDKAIGQAVGVAHVGVWPVVAGAALTAGQDVQSDATGAAIPLAAGLRAGTVIEDVANGALGFVRLAC